MSNDSGELDLTEHLTEVQLRTINRLPFMALIKIRNRFFDPMRPTSLPDPDKKKWQDYKKYRQIFIDDYIEALIAVANYLISQNFQSGNLGDVLDMAEGKYTYYTEAEIKEAQDFFRDNKQLASAKLLLTGGR